MSLYAFEVTDIRGNTGTLEPWKGQVLLIVNTATGCGFARQFGGLESLYQKYRDHGFAVLGFPCRQFMRQEFSERNRIEQACRRDHGVTFPLFAVINVNGPGAHPLFRHLKREARGFLGTRSIKWNFTKFLVDRDGRVVRRFAPATTPETMEPHIRGLLGV